MNETFCRIAAPSALGAFSLLCLGLPMLRHRLAHGTGSGFVIDRVQDPAARALGYAMTAQSNLVMAHAVTFAAFGAAPLGVWTGVPDWLAYVGLGFVATAVGLVMTSQATMGRNWRMCVDDRPTDLVTDGPFSLVRNPIYVGTILLNSGLALIAPSAWSVMLVWCGGWFVAMQARFEETHLARLHGASYVAYAKRTGRFLPGVGRLEEPAS